MIGDTSTLITFSRNEPAIKFYSRIGSLSPSSESSSKKAKFILLMLACFTESGAKLLKEWVPVRLDVNGISNFLSSFSQPNEHPIAP